MTKRTVRLEIGEDDNKFKGRIVKKSLDARKKDDIHYVLTIVDGKAENKLIIPGSDLVSRPVVVGFGPAGMFAALYLARSGANPIVLERGPDVARRIEAVEEFRHGGIFNPDANAQFGEGGAGTFSDGKLNTGTHDERISFVINEFYLHGAPESITYDAKPHIGTDILVDVVKNIREEIISLGGEILFDTKLEKLVIENGEIAGVIANGEKLDCSSVILAIGHSARDTFEALLSQDIPMQRKAFSMGARIEHLQYDIDEAQYARHDLPAADYKLSYNGTYTFCMCPGGEVFAAASEDGGVCTNGMSYSKRSGKNANSAVLVSVLPEDFPGDGVLAGMYWQREIEQKAFLYGGQNYYATCQTVGDFLNGTPSDGPGKVIPTYKPGIRWGDISEILPEKIIASMKEALPVFDRKIHGFASGDAVLTAPETRSSSPVRILRDETCQSKIKGLYPCGEGAGYAGGITSSAVDGLRCAEALIKNGR